MSELQLDLFAEVAAPVDAIQRPPHTDESLLIQGAGQPTGAEPIRFVLADPEGRWTITTSHEDEVRRGKTTRRLVGRCSCGWVSEFGLHSYGRSSPDRLLAHLRSHQLESRPPAWQVEAERRLAEGTPPRRTVHCASAQCHRLGPLTGRRGRDLSAEYRLTGGFGEPCIAHGGALYDRPYHWDEHDPEDHSGELRQSFAGGLLDPQGVFWHFWCAPLEGRRLFGFLRAEERSAPADDRSQGEDAFGCPHPCSYNERGMTMAQQSRTFEAGHNGAP
ncbi:MAG: hypothetical protein M5U18_04215 [Dehalococcoidia bacterium]|nr:hypothetical protein [Dehalococcoidia bacterium]